jgi:methylglyoxal reductase
MRRRRLGASDISISRITIGAYLRGPEKDLIRAMHLAFDHGVNAVDTAPMYGCGASELAVGKALAGHRHRVVVMTKAGIRWDDPRGRPLWTIEDPVAGRVQLRLNSRPSSLILEVERSLSRLGVDRIDVLHIHQYDPDTPLDEVMGTLVELHRQGKIRAVGLSKFPRALAEKAAKYLGGVPLAAVQGEYSLIAREAERELFSGRWGLLAYRVLGQGALGRAARPVPGDSRRWAPEFALGNRSKISKAIETVLAPIARRHHATIAQVAIAWVLAHDEVTSAIVGASGERQTLENVTALEVQLTESEIATLGDTFARAQIDSGASTALLGRAERFLRRVFRRP